MNTTLAEIISSEVLWRGGPDFYFAFGGSWFDMK